jgi:hypothetical protein
MRHPLLKSHSEVRKRVIALLAVGLSVWRAGNLIFVCGGNDTEHQRPKFIAAVADQLDEFELFQPEYAMRDYFSDCDGEPMDLGEFETLIGELSHAIIIFPEAPGSFAETGYFANVDRLAEKTILVLDSQRQKNDSFVVMGPARKFEEKSRFRSNIQLNYTNPDYSVIVDRIRRVTRTKTRKFLEIQDDIFSYDLFCLIYKIFDILIVATIDDLLFILTSLTNGHPPRKKARQLASILVGAGYLRPIGEYGHYFADRKGDELVKMKEGFADKESKLKIEILEIVSSGEVEFRELLKERSNAS